MLDEIYYISNVDIDLRIANSNDYVLIWWNNECFNGGFEATTTTKFWYFYVLFIAYLTVSHVDIGFN